MPGCTNTTSPSAGSGASTPCNGVTTPCPFSMIHAQLGIKEITFTDNQVVEKDTLGNFPSPEWQQGRSAAQNAPVCYVRNNLIKLTAKFNVTRRPSAAEFVIIRGRANIGTINIILSGSVEVGPSDSEVSLNLTGSPNLQNSVQCIDAFDIDWEYNPAATGFSPAGTSSHLLYIVLGIPSSTPAYWTLLDISCRAAAGAMTEADLVSRAYTPFRGRVLKRKRDGRGLTYWNPATTSATNTQQLLSSADGSGQCGSWSEFLVDMFKCHGITSAAKVYIGQTVPHGPVGFLVKNWSFIGTGTQPPPWTHMMGSECSDRPGIPGQRNPNPPGGFYNHFIVLHGGKFYDPSYGSAPVAAKVTWENSAIDGLFQSGLAGYKKTLHTGTNLLRFYNLTTGSAI